jgi:hypothetical protein
MAVSFNTSNIAFSQKNNFQDRKKDAEKKVVTGGGAVAATASAARLNATKSGIDMFASTGKVSRGLTTFTNTAKTATNTAKQTRSLWAKVCENAKWAKNAILNWGSNVKTMKMFKPLIESRVFRFGAGALGYGFGAVTLISGLSDITRVTTDTVEKLNNK